MVERHTGGVGPRIVQSGESSRLQLSDRRKRRKIQLSRAKRRKRCVRPDYSLPYRQELSGPRNCRGERTARKSRGTSCLPVARESEVTMARAFRRGSGRITRLSLSRRPRSDQSSRDVDRIVVRPDEVFDGAQHRVMKAVSQIRDFGDPRWPTVEVLCALIKDSLKHKSYGDTTRRHRRRHTTPGGYRQLEQRLQAPKSPPLRLV